LVTQKRGGCNEGGRTGGNRVEKKIPQLLGHPVKEAKNERSEGELGKKRGGGGRILQPFQLSPLCFGRGSGQDHNPANLEFCLGGAPDGKVGPGHVQPVGKRKNRIEIPKLLILGELLMVHIPQSGPKGSGENVGGKKKRKLENNGGYSESEE